MAVTCGALIGVLVVPRLDAKMVFNSFAQAERKLPLYV